MPLSASVWLTFAVIWTGESLLRRRVDRPARVARNLWLGVILRLLVTPLVLAPVLHLVVADAPWRQALAPVVSWCLSLLGLDLLNYATHLAAHKIPVLWRFHKIHHMDEVLDASTAFRVHAGEKILPLPVKALLVSALGIPLVHLLVYEAISASFGVLHHADLQLPRRFEAALCSVFALPLFHRLHHHARLPYTDSNYGFVLSLWDHLFATARRAPPGFTPEFGLDTDPETTWPQLLAKPFLPATLPVTVNPASYGAQR